MNPGGQYLKCSEILNYESLGRLVGQGAPIHPCSLQGPTGPQNWSDIQALPNGFQSARSGLLYGQPQVRNPHSSPIPHQALRVQEQHSGGHSLPYLGPLQCHSDPSAQNNRTHWAQFRRPVTYFQASGWLGTTILPSTRVTQNHAVA